MTVRTAARGGPVEKAVEVQDDPSSTPTTPASAARHRLLAAGAAGVVVLLGGIGAFASLRSDPPAPPATTASTTAPTTVSTTTTPPPVLPPGTVEVATAKSTVRTVRVRATEPETWSTSARSVVVLPRPRPPFSSTSRPERPALPRPDYPLTGRVAVDDGWEFGNPGPYDPAQPFTMLVTERRGDWTKVRVPVRPNGTEGWVRTSDVEISTTRQRIDVHLGERTLRAWDGDRLLVETPVVVGSPSTQTPTGVFYVTDEVPYEHAGGSYGPVALATDGYSEMMDQFDTGVPVIALHGTNRPELAGQALSNGCIRVPNEAIQQLADTLAPGTPVHIWP